MAPKGPCSNTLPRQSTIPNREVPRSRIYIRVSARRRGGADRPNGVSTAIDPGRVTFGTLLAAIGPHRVALLLQLRT